MSSDLSHLSEEELGHLFPIFLSDYDPGWKDLFKHEERLILDCVSKDYIASIEHIGSTAIPGICAKPTIDILIEITDGCDCDELVKMLQDAGYDSIPKPENPPPHIMLAKGYSISGIHGQTYHIHLRYTGDWDEKIFRDYLLVNRNLAKAYGELKKKLSVEFRNNREKYTDGKTEFITMVTKKARMESRR
jgi:GrpB-like predicted nucleotidyltransferase (UPF0157 family)